MRRARRKRRRDSRTAGPERTRMLGKRRRSTRSWRA
nr:MAG TPA_asm: hypothetical protein [Caudoviricetes sp.]